MLEIGLRVVRGPDWKWAQQDDGEGHVGTVVELGKPGSNTSPDKTVVVQWDSGSRTNYRVGYQSAYDLRVYDNAPIGVRHPNVICDACRKHGIIGMRWKCARCFDFDLCTHCYMALDKHDLTHPFLRFETATNTQGVKVPPRSQSLDARLIAKGIFKGAVVVRGADWDWGDQDGGPGGQGKVQEIKGWENESGRSVAAVSWLHNPHVANVYRVGHKGKVDLKYVHEAKNGQYYKTHLPVLGEHIERLVPPLEISLYSVGDKVRVMSDIDLVKQLQEGHGGWNIRMADVLGKEGHVHRVTERGDVRVQFHIPGDNNQDSSSSIAQQNRWTFHPGALCKIHSFSVGDQVIICGDEQRLKQAQKGHGEWSHDMIGALGKQGKVLQVYGDGDIRVSVNGQSFTFNPQCCTPLTTSSSSLLSSTSHNTLQAYQAQQQMEYASSIDWSLQGGSSIGGGTTNSSSCKQMLIYNTLLAHNDTLSSSSIVRDAAQGKIQAVRDALNKNPQLVESRSGDKSALMLAAHQGHIDIVRILLSHGANLEQRDADGDTALHYACFGNQPDCISLLLSKGADINSTNSTGCSSLHIAINKQLLECTKRLLELQQPPIDVNLQDIYGDTALHDIANTRVFGHFAGLDELASCGTHPSVLNLIKELEETRHQTSLIPSEENSPDRSNNECIDGRELIDLLLSVSNINFNLKNKRGFNVLHHAALKGNAYVTWRLIELCRQLVDSKKDDGFSSLHLACLNGHLLVTCLLLRCGHATVEICNSRKQTPLHLAVAQGHSSIVILLVRDHRASTKVLDEDGDTPLHLILSKTQQSDDSCLILLASDLIPQMPVDYRQIPNIVLAAFLIKCDAPLLVKNRQNKLPLDYVSDQKLKEYFILLNRSTIIKQVMPNTSALSPCIICDECPADILFEPCKHKISCKECCIKMKRCVLCQLNIDAKYAHDGQLLTSSSTNVTRHTHRLPSTAMGNNSDGEIISKVVRELETKVQELEDGQSCSICMERSRNVAFLCGHTACSNCAQPLKTCHICRKPITKKINLYS
ncbi:unnamed protein product [Rotaria sp. Silwood1]|nr:unnamed protein product [Rotaria sp. Silwood1]CAF1125892.1 unnamed protein product [Rotaria sp. Silwood1]CAF1253069.1 unnamed protein product [Rotaria sp. Silwood1]CAF3438496.1 unnamed protein product [Rotaria sp. Silwood1]CAF3460590.1 unnamed protein product [Rotaria sp. Silwood1]